MATRASRPDGAEQGLGDNPLADPARDPLLDAFYGPGPAKRATKKKRGKGRQPLKDGKTFRLVTFSFYEEDVARLDKLLQEARRRGHRRVSRSQIVRLALRQVDLSQLPEEV
ncbi:MAG: hypothetical protein FJ137_13280 [Deltaproteobacteria bacterium]|nr:hypothetical protein [Deltaproteobacteria bacterium]